jgi:exonuclease SbcD
MRFVHIADTHLGLAAFHKMDPDSGMNLRERLIYDNFLESVEIMIRQKPDVLVHAGDLFDRVKPKTRAYTTVLTALDRLEEEGIPLIVISGNHSMPKTRYTPSPFEILEYHSAELHAAYRYRYERLELGDTVFHLIPNMLHAEDYMDASNQVELSKAHSNVLVTHGLASTLHEYRLKTVAEHELNATILSPEFDYIALGHFHGQQQVADNAWYSGSPEFCSYGEIFDEKGGLVVDLNRNIVEHLDLPRVPMLHLGKIPCEGLSAAEINQEIRECAARLPEGFEQGMALLVCDAVSANARAGIDRMLIGQVRSAILDFKVQVRSDESSGVSFESKDLSAVDYVEEFEMFLAKKHLDKETYAHIAQKGSEILKTVLKRHQEGSDEA